MKFLFELFPLILFFVAFKLSGIYVATGVAIIATICQILWSWFVKRKVEAMMWFNLAVISVFGGLTIYLRDPTFIKWKPTVLYWAFAIVLSCGTLFFNKNLIKTAMSKQIELPEAIWQKLNWSWVAFFVFMGAANLIVAFALGLSLETWTTFKVFGGMGLMLIFVIIQGVFLSKYIEEGESQKKVGE